MAASDQYKAYVWQACGATVTARVRNLAGSYITQASLSSISRKVYDEDNADASILATSLTVSSVVYDTLQHADADLVLWTRDGVLLDSVGWNFLDNVPAAAFPLGKSGTRLNRRYLVEWLFTPTSGEVFAMQWLLSARDLKSTAS